MASRILHKGEFALSDQGRMDDVVHAPLMCLWRGWCMKHSSHPAKGGGLIPTPRSKLVIRPCELKDANAFITELHRHHKRVQGHRFSQSVWLDDIVLVGVACTGRPVARKTDQRNVVEVTRLCTDGT